MNDDFIRDDDHSKPSAKALASSGWECVIFELADDDGEAAAAAGS